VSATPPDSFAAWTSPSTVYDSSGVASTTGAFANCTDSGSESPLFSAFSHTVSADARSFASRSSVVDDSVVPTLTLQLHPATANTAHAAVPR
jgi:hypothetical protein